MIVELVKLGFLGFATAILIFSFLLLQKIIESKDFEGDNLLIRCKQIRTFMLMSIAVILIGMAWELIDPNVSLKFDVSPKDAKGLVVKVGGKEIDFKSDNDISVKDRYEVSLDLVGIDRQLRELANRIEFLELNSLGTKNQLKTIKKQQVENDLKNALISD